MREGDRVCWIDEFLKEKNLGFFMKIDEDRWMLYEDEDGEEIKEK